jgi:hypothetical protein
LASRKHVLLAALAAALVVAGCGSGTPTGSPPAPKTAGTTVRTGNSKGLGAYVINRGDESGFATYGPITTELSDADWAELPGLSAARTTRETKRLVTEGYVGGISRELVGVGTPGEGDSTVARFSTAAGAAQAQSDLEGQFTKVYRRRIQPAVPVPGIPGGTEELAINPSGATVKIIWVEGSCLLSISNASVKNTAAPLIVAAQGIYGRTQGHCS